MNATEGINQWANDNMPMLIAGLVVVLAASVLVIRALRRAKAARDGLTIEQRDTRARRVEDGLTVAVAMVASGLSMTGLWYYAQDVLHLTGAWRVLPYFGLDAAVIVCAIRARRRAHNNEAAGWNGRLVWIFAIISAVFGFSEGGSLWGGFGRAVWPLIAATLFELGLIEQRHAAQRNTERRLNLGWAHPIERLRVYSVLSAESTLTADEATHEVRVNAAAKALHRLRHADTAATAGGWPARAKLRRVERRTQRALLRAKFSDPQVTAEVLQRTQALVRTRDFARMDYSALDEARAMMTDAIDHSVLPTNKRPRPARRPEQKTPTAPEPTAPRASDQSSAPIARAPEQAPAPAVRGDVDQDAHDPRVLVHEVFKLMVAEDDSDKPDAAEVRRRAFEDDPDSAPHAATVRRWVQKHWDDHVSARGARAPEPMSTRAEVHIADPEPDPEISVDTHPRHAAAHVA